ncbi:protein translocase subunit SecD [Feifania hominis]|uniref:Protein translocase subunit SecD n=1 Tax=Feifania hominis TaxID=2763660 RepID=A0A926DA58_9FIRM|nr:protein translocase subunit SecD [Feifania hominis]MBC8535225.1 protein translocase subunit SecD [Feifania hominis]
MWKSVLSFLLVLAIIAGLALTAAFGIDLGDYYIPSVADKDNGVRLGLDLVGGSSITFEAQDVDNLSADELKRGMESAKTILQTRLTDLGYTEATIQISGDRRLLVEIPSVTDPNEAVEKLGSTAELTFTDIDGKVYLTGSDVKSAQVGYETTSSGAKQYVVMLEFTQEGKQKFAEATEEIAKRDATKYENLMVISLDGTPQSWPRVSERLEGENIYIEGNFTAEDATWLANLISAGQMPFALKDVELRAVGPTLGEKSLETSLFAAAVGIALVMVFMLVVYRVPGLVADIALVFYVALVAVILTVLRVNLSLPGIAGIILSIGMAVDANVIIFERIKEELRNGKSTRAAIKAGFSRAFSAILDSNITTLIAAVVLRTFGTGPIVGFADTLLIGVITSMFTAIFVSRFLLNRLVDMKIKNARAYGV